MTGEKRDDCPFCGGKIRREKRAGTHFFVCQDPGCGAEVSFKGDRIAGMAYGILLKEAEDPERNFARRSGSQEDWSRDI